MPTVSVIIPTYNRSQYLREALTSILNQTYTDFEIVITDNASTDDTENVVAEFKDERIRYYKNKKNIGVVANHNLAFSKSTGEYIHIFSDDDIMSPNCLQLKLKAFNDNKSVVLIHSNIDVIDSDGNITSDKHWAYGWDFSKDILKNRVAIEGKIALKYLLEHWNFISMPSVMIKGDVVKKSKYLSTKLHLFCDWGYWCTISKFGNSLYLDEKTVSYRNHKHNTIHQSKYKQSIKELLIINFNNIKFLIFAIQYPYLIYHLTNQIVKYLKQKPEGLYKYFYLIINFVTKKIKF